MFKDSNFNLDSNFEEWAIRSENWISELAKLPAKRKRRERNSTPLILCGNGVSMRIEKGALVIRDGFTHHPQTQTVHRYFRGDLALPPRILLLDGSGTLSFDVLSWLAEQNVALARISWTGDVATVASGSGFIGDRDKIGWQYGTRADEGKRIAFSVDLIRRKLQNSIETLETHIASSRLRELAIAKARDSIERLREVMPDIKTVRGIEGECAVAYFAAWRGMSLRWKGLDKHPIPDEWQQFRSRSSIASGVRAKNKMAAHPINAMLNYAYTVKLAQMQIQTVADGFDPTVGIMHHEFRGKPVFVFDMIEPERPKIDAIILAFIASRTFHGADFVIRSDGVCRLSPQLARMIAVIVA